MMLLKRFHDDNEPIVAPKRFRIYKNRENIRKHWKTLEHGLGMEWNRRISEMSEYGKHQSVERSRKTAGNVRNVGVQNRKMSEMSEYGIGRHRKHWSVK